MTELKDCLGRITRPLQACKTCLKDQYNLRCPEYQPCQSIELIEVVGEDNYLNQTDDVPKRLDDRLK